MTSPCPKKFSLEDLDLDELEQIHVGIIKALTSKGRSTLKKEDLEATCVCKWPLAVVEA